jgi:hypothetical protein
MLLTVRLHNLPVKIITFNNSSLGTGLIDLARGVKRRPRTIHVQMHTGTDAHH